MNRAKFGIIRMWQRLPVGLRNKPLDALVSILLIMYALSIGGFDAFDPFDFLHDGLTFYGIVDLFVTAYLVIGSLLVISGLVFHQRHLSIMSFCRRELWGWRLLFSACSVIFIAEATISGLSLATVIWFLQATASMFKMFQYYSERSMERKIWTQ